MRTICLRLLLVLAAVLPGAVHAECPAILDHDVRALRSGESVDLCARYAGRPLLIVNTASHCGFTPQFSGLEALYQRYRERGFAILGVPSDSFRQAAKDEASAAEICYVNYGVTFQMLETLPVQGPQAHPLFRALAQAAGAPRWNFNKYLLDADGRVVGRYDSTVEPLSQPLTRDIERLLDAAAAVHGYRLARAGEPGPVRK